MFGCTKYVIGKLLIFGDVCTIPMLNLQGLDYVIAQAATCGIRVILTLTNYWPDYGGPPTWAHWFNRSSIVEFYQDPAIR